MKIINADMYFSYYWDTDCSARPRRGITHHFKCCICDLGLEYQYNFIISSLRKAGLLSVDYKPLCCVCYSHKMKAEEEGKMTAYYAYYTKTVIKERKQKWKQHFPHLKIRCKRKPFLANWGVGTFVISDAVSRHLRIDLCEICAREECTEEIGRTGECDGYVPDDEHRPVNPMLQVEEFNEAMDEREGRIPIHDGQSN